MWFLCLTSVQALWNFSIWYFLNLNIFHRLSNLMEHAIYSHIKLLIFSLETLMYTIYMAWIKYAQVRVEAASTIATMLEGQALVLIQVAEYKESSKRGSFTTLSSSLGQILMQLHTGRGVTDIFRIQYCNILDFFLPPEIVVDNCCSK